MSNPTEQELRTARDRELVILAAKAVDLWTSGRYDFQFGLEVMRPHGAPFTWNPLHDDGDALRLAVKLSIYIQPFTESCVPSVFARGMNKIGTEQVLPLGDDPCAATRRAVVGAAAEIGRRIDTPQ